MRVAHRFYAVGVGPAGRTINDQLDVPLQPAVGTRSRLRWGRARRAMRDLVMAGGGVAPRPHPPRPRRPDPAPPGPARAPLCAAAGGPQGGGPRAAPRPPAPARPVSAPRV